jgi:hypothetical protein
MAGLNELVAVAPAVVAAVSVAVQCRLLRVSDSGLFAYGLIMATAIAVPAAALSLVPADAAAQAAADLGVMLAGAMAFAASGWLLFAFRAAGDAGGR